MAVTAFFQVKDSATTTLNGAINDSVTTITVTDGSVFPTTGNQFILNIDAEDILIDSRSSNVLTVNASGRGYNGTVAASHADGATVNLTVQAKNIQQIHTAVQGVEAATFPGITVAKGDILTRQASGDGALAPLNIGSAGKTLASVNGVPAWLYPSGYGMINGKITTAVASNNLTVSIKTLAGTDPSATDPVYVRIDNTLRAITGALSVTLNAGTNWFNAGASSATTGTLATFESDYFVYLIWNTTDGAVSVGFARAPYQKTYSDFNSTNTHQNYLAYSGSAPAATDEVTIVGRFNATLSATNNWSIPATSIIVQRPIYNTRVLSFTPGWQGTGSNPAIVNGSIQGAYHFTTNQLYILVTITMGSSTTFGTGTYRFYCPMWAYSSSRPGGSVRILDAGTANRGGFTPYFAGGSSYFEVYGASGDVTPTSPQTFASGDSITISAQYLTFP